jgi:hypothetical protein
MTDRDDERRQVAGPEDKDAPWELPERQALSILTGGTSGLLPTLDGTTAPTDTSGAPTAGDAGGAGAQAGDTAGQLAQTAQTTGDASGSGQESITSEPRSETFVSSDSASAES